LHLRFLQIFSILYKVLDAVGNSALIGGVGAMLLGMGILF
jgi:hypothetical protein